MITYLQRDQISNIESCPEKENQNIKWFHKNSGIFGIGSKKEGFRELRIGHTFPNYWSRCDPKLYNNIIRGKKCMIKSKLMISMKDDKVYHFTFDSIEKAKFNHSRILNSNSEFIEIKN